MLYVLWHYHESTYTYTHICKYICSFVNFNSCDNISSYPYDQLYLLIMYNYMTKIHTHVAFSNQGRDQKELPLRIFSRQSIQHSRIKRKNTASIIPEGKCLIFIKFEKLQKIFITIIK